MITQRKGGKGEDAAASLSPKLLEECTIVKLLRCYVSVFATGRGNQGDNTGRDTGYTWREAKAGMF